ncbi:MAG: hypothetical protein NTV08_03270 [Verrucomicrobia bacterium]|nr:hypothetical protein [Verrucomicrobiota bacterium]
MYFDDGRLAIDGQRGNFRTWFIDCINFVATKWRTLIAGVNLLVPVPLDTVSPGGDQTPSLPGADPRSDRFRHGGREKKFLQKSLTKPGVNARPQ